MRRMQPRPPDDPGSLVAQSLLTQGEGGFMDASVVGENQPSVAQLLAVRGGEGTFP